MKTESSVFCLLPGLPGNVELIHLITNILPEDGAGEGTAWSEASRSPSEHCSTSTSTSSSGRGDRQLDAGELSDAGELCLDTEPVQ